MVLEINSFISVIMCSLLLQGIVINFLPSLEILYVCLFFQETITAEIINNIHVCDIGFPPDKLVQFWYFIDYDISLDWTL